VPKVEWGGTVSAVVVEEVLWTAVGLLIVVLMLWTWTGPTAELNTWINILAIVSAIAAKKKNPKVLLSGYRVILEQ
jgi:hypothetical protein